MKPNRMVTAHVVWTLKNEKGKFRTWGLSVTNIPLVAAYATKKEALLDQAQGETPVKARATMICEEMVRGND